MSNIDKLIGSIDRKMKNKISDKDLIKGYHEKITITLDKERPDPNDFHESVDSEKISNDIRKVAELEKRWETLNSEEQIEAKRMSDIAEYIIYKNLGTWINYKANPLLASKPDDYLRGIDLIIESEDDPNDKNQDIRHLGLGIDIALVSEKNADIESKKKKMERNLEQGKLTEARYVTGASFEGSLYDLPYTILSISSKHINDLVSSVLQKTSTEKEKKHIIKYIVAYQILLQLGTYYKVSSARKFDTTAYQYALANNFAHDIFQELIDELQTDTELWKQVSSDVGVQEIEKFCKSLERILT